ncbi:MAG: hypothetical protein M3R63_12170 [Actinomycetota bacterium]|nr:hypothetical protein [Actinomycetota bacterium]
MFVPFAALGLMLLMIGAAVTDQRRGEQPMIAGNIGCSPWRLWSCGADSSRHGSAAGGSGGLQWVEECWWDEDGVAVRVEVDIPAGPVDQDVVAAAEQPVG